MIRNALLIGGVGFWTGRRVRDDERESFPQEWITKISQLVEPYYKVDKIPFIPHLNPLVGNLNTSVKVPNL